MDRQLIHHMLQADFERLLGLLTTQQHLHPHDTVAATLAKTVDEIGVCPNAVETALQRLGIDEKTVIGRFRRTELIQLARTVHRFWRHEANSATPQRQPQ